MSTNGRNRPRRASSRAREEFSAGGVVVRMVDGSPRFLLIRDGYGHWGFPKGHVERGERADAAALREVMEETGLRALALVGSIEAIEWHFRFRGALIHKRCEFFLMTTDSDATRPQKAEGITACKWASADAAVELIGYENARAVLRHAAAMIEARAEAAPGRWVP